MNWICIEVTRSLCNNGEITVRKELEGKIGRVLDYRFVDDKRDTNQYIFAKIANENDVSKLQDARHFVNVISSFNDIIYLTEDDVFAFTDEPTDTEPKEHFQYGDIVIPSDGGPYDSLNGIVINDGNVLVEVIFRFHTMVAKVIYKIDEVHKIGTIFDYVESFPEQKYPILSEE